MFKRERSSNESTEHMRYDSELYATSHKSDESMYLKLINTTDVFNNFTITIALNRIGIITAYGSICARYR